MTQRDYFDQELGQHHLKLIPSSVKHRSVVALKSIPRGTTVFVEQSVATVTQLTEQPICGWCLEQQTTKMLRCSACKMVAYCSASCQRSDWRAGHSAACKVVANSSSSKQLFHNISSVLDLQTMAKIGCWLSASGAPNTAEATPTVNIPATAMISRSIQRPVFLSLLTHIADMPKQSVDAMIAATTAWKAISTSLPDPSEAIQHIRRVRCNSFTITDPEMFGIAEGTFPVTSLLNHSCEPNCIAVFHRDLLILRTIADVAIDEELTISYIDSISDVNERSRQLEQKYHFTCDCGKCSAERDHPASRIPHNTPQLSLNAALVVIDWYMSHLECSHEDFVQSRKLLVASKLISESKMDSDALGLASREFQQSIELQDWDRAVVSGSRVFAINAVGYPRFHPLTTMRAFELAKCLWNNGSTDKTVAVMQSVVKSLGVSHGDTLPWELLCGPAQSFLEMALGEQQQNKTA